MSDLRFTIGTEVVTVALNGLNYVRPAKFGEEPIGRVATSYPPEGYVRVKFFSGYTADMHPLPVVPVSKAIPVGTEVVVVVGTNKLRIAQPGEKSVATVVQPFGATFNDEVVKGTAAWVKFHNNITKNPYLMSVAEPEVKPAAPSKTITTCRTEYEPKLVPVEVSFSQVYNGLAFRAMRHETWQLVLAYNLAGAALLAEAVRVDRAREVERWRKIDDSFHSRQLQAIPKPSTLNEYVWDEPSWMDSRRMVAYRKGSLLTTTLSPYGVFGRWDKYNKPLAFYVPPGASDYRPSPHVHDGGDEDRS